MVGVVDINLIDEIFIQRINRRVDPAVGALLYGSRINGSANEDPDIDLMIFWRSKSIFYERKKFLWKGVILDVLEVGGGSLSEVVRMQARYGDFLIASAVESGKFLFFHDKEFFLRALETSHEIINSQPNDFLTTEQISKMRLDCTLLLLGFKRDFGTAQKLRLLNSYGRIFPFTWPLAVCGESQARTITHQSRM
jgi:predicted nucleotidyltransferase